MFDSPATPENNQVQHNQAPNGQFTEDQRGREPAPRSMDTVVGLRPRLRRVLVATMVAIALVGTAAGVVIGLSRPSVWVAVGAGIGWLAVLAGGLAAVQVAVRPVDEQLSAERTARTNAERAAWEAHWRAGAAQSSLEELQRELTKAISKAGVLLGDGVKELTLLAEQIRRGNTPSPQPAEVVLAGWPTTLGDLEPSARQLVRTGLAVGSQTSYHQPVGVLITLARRLQPLIHRSIKELDALESQVEDPDLLNALFQLDHLVTRARRQAESIAVLGGATARQIRKPVPVYTVLRQAIAEIEHYERVKVLRPVHGTIVGHAVTEVIHLIAELVENATAFSPPESRVQIQVDLVPDGLSIEIDDLGLVMPAEQRQRMNQLLAAPDRLDIAEQLKDGRIGLIVVAAIAHRYQIRVRLERNERGGNRALVVLPAKVLSEEPAVPVRPSELGRHAATPAPIMVPSHRGEHSDPVPAAWVESGQNRMAIPRGTASVIQSLPPAPASPTPLNPAPLNPATLNPTTLNPTTLNPATLNPATLNPATLSPATLNPATPGPAEPEPDKTPPRPALPRRDGPHMAPELRGGGRPDGVEPGRLASELRGGARPDSSEPGRIDPGLLASYQRGRERADREEPPQVPPSAS
jgi:signal transduction histidine kinase